MATSTSEILSSVMSKSRQTKLTEQVSKGQIQEVDVKSFDHHPPHFWQVGNSIDKIQQHVFQKDRMCIYPVVAPRSDDNVLIDIKDRLLAGSCQTGFAYTAKSMAVSANINSKPKPKEALYDVILFVLGKPTTVFTVIEDTSTRKAKCEALKYTQSIAKGLVKGIRQLTDEQFSVVFGLVTKTDVTDDVLFCDAIDAIKAKTSRLCVPITLAMPEQKYQKVTRAFLLSVAITDSVCSEGEDDSLWFLTLNQFCALTHNIDEAEVVLSTSPACGGKVLLLDVAKRLQKSGPTMLVLQTEALVEAASRADICSSVLHAENVTKEIMKEKMPCILNIVTDSDVVGLVQNLKVEGSVWYFKQQSVPDLKPTERSVNIGVLPKDKLGCQELLNLPVCGHSSWLRKQCLWNKGRMFHWPKVFVVLCEGCLYYYFNETAKAPVGSFSLYGFNSVSRALEIPPKETSWVFKLVHTYADYKTYLFSASSEEEMKEWMKRIKTEMVLANLGTTPPNTDEGGYRADVPNVYSEIESDIYINVQEFVVPQNYTTKRTGDYSEDADLFRMREHAITELISRSKQEPRKEETTFTPLSQQEFAKSRLTKLRRGTPDGSSVEKKEQADTLSLTDADAVSEKEKKNFWASIHFLEADKENASLIINILGEDGVYLVRDGTDGHKVLVVFLEDKVRKFRISFEQDVYFLESNKKAYFSSLEELMYHYHSANLPHYSATLITPYQLHPMFSKSMILPTDVHALT